MPRGDGPDGPFWRWDGVTPMMCGPIRGRIYPSVRAASKALGVRPRTIYSAMERGTLDKVGLGRWPSLQHSSSPNRRQT